MRYSKSTYELTSDTQITTKPGVLCSCLILTDGTNDATVIIYDVDDVADIDPTNKLFEWTVTGANNSGGRNWTSPVSFVSGLYMDITGTGASTIIEFGK